MALIHNAELVPSKLDMLASWVPSQPWGGDDLQVVGAYRFDDPDGQVGLETHLVRASDGRVLQVPVSYRNLELAGGDAHLIGTMEHSVLGRRWVYDAAGDPVYVRALAAALLAGTPQAQLEYEVDGGIEIRDPNVRVSRVGDSIGKIPTIVTVTETSTPTSTVIATGELRITVLRVLGTPGAVNTPGPVLTGTWAGSPGPVELVRLG